VGGWWKVLEQLPFYQRRNQKEAYHQVKHERPCTPNEPFSTRDPAPELGNGILHDNLAAIRWIRPGATDI
jgi:hypothetical protein